MTLSNIINGLNQVCLEHRDPPPVVCELPDLPNNLINSESRSSYGLIAANATLPQRVEFSLFDEK